MFEGMSDDQVAIIGCGIAFFVCMGMMIISHSLRQALTRDNQRKVTHRFPTPETGEAVASDERKAA